VQTFFNREEKERYSPFPQLDGRPVDYAYKGSDSKWSAVVLGHELASVDSAEALKEKAISPLLAAAQQAGIL